MGETVVSTSRLSRILETTASSVTVEAGVTVQALQDHLASRGAWFPPAPTFTGACCGGIVATNAAGAATFKYGSTREWVEALTVVLADGSALHLTRRECRAVDGWLDIGGRRVPVPPYAMPNVVKKSAGYFAAPGMDAVDLFIGSEGTLGIITDVTLRVVSPAPASALALIPCTSEREALALTTTLRNPAYVAAIESMDRRCIEILTADGATARHQVALPSDTQMALLVHLELEPGITSEAAYEEIAQASASAAEDSALAWFCGVLSDAGLLDGTELALPGDSRRREQLIAIREAVPAGVNQRVGIAKHTVDERIAKTAADMIVPYENFAAMNEIYRRGFEARGLDYAIWGHISDGNVHPNVIPRDYRDVARGREAILEFGREAVRLGGCPLAEHGVGRSAVKQELLRQMYGDEGIAAMRAVKRTLDPDGKLAPGVIFPSIMAP